VTAPGVVVFTFAMPRGARFNCHTHDDHQLAWASTGVLTVTTGAATWVLPPSRALWIPARVPHEVMATDGATMTAAYLRPEGCPIRWTQPTPIAVGGLLRELVVFLSTVPLDRGRRDRAEAVLFDVFEPVEVTSIDVRLPTDVRALEVALAIQANPADTRSLAEWGRSVGASGRTLSRAFLTDTGVPFGRWRTVARLQAALPFLAAGEPVGNVAHAIGYDTPSAFVAAFRREVGVTPGAYFRPRSG
jgi:AraC-like DNA-binding protein